MRTSWLIRPSKLRLPDSTAQTTRSFSFDRLRDLLGQRPGVADAGRAAVADQVEPELVEVLRRGPACSRYSVTTVEPGASEVFTQGLALEPRSTAFFANSPAPTITVGLDVLVQLVIAAITTRPWSSCVSVPSSSVTVTGSAVAFLDHRAARHARLARDRRCAPRPAGREAGKVPATASSWLFPRLSAASGSNSRSDSRKAAFASASGIRSCGRFGPAMLGPTLAEVQLERLGEGRLLGVLGVEQPLLAGVGVHQLDQLGRPPGELEVAEGLRGPPGRSRRWSRTRATCCRSSPDPRAPACAARVRRTRRTSPPRRARGASR